MFPIPTKACARPFLIAMLIALFLLPAQGYGATGKRDTIGDVPVAERDDGARAPKLSMEAGVLVTRDGRTLWARASDAKRAMASTTKIMTAICVLEQGDMGDRVTVSRKAAATSESAAEIAAGKRYTVQTLLEAMLVKSGNDAAVALAEHLAGSEMEFVSAMNKKAQELGLVNTHFANSHGLDESSHYSCAGDLGVMARYAMSKPAFRDIVGRESVKIRRADGGGGSTLENSNRLIGSFLGATGVKTGWTSDAGYCLVASAERNGIELYAVVLGSKTESSRFDEAERLLEWGFDHYREQELVTAGSFVADVMVSDYLDVSVPTAVEETVLAEVFDLDGEVAVRLAMPPSVEAPVAVGDRVGTMSFVQGDRLLAQVPVVASADVEKPGLLERTWIWVMRGWRGLFGYSGTAYEWG